MNLKRIVIALVAGVLALGLFFAWWLQPERQVRRHTAALLGAVERRNWDRFGSMLADTYSDRWGHDKTNVIENLDRVFSQFIFLTVEHEITALDVGDTRASTTTRVKMSGQGGAVAQFVISKVNGLSEPFVFVWQKQGKYPWSWQLTSVEHPSLEPNMDGAL